MRSIGKVLHNTVGHLEEVADGSLDVMVQNKVLERNDELGEVSRSLQKLVSSFKEIVKNIMTASAELDSFSGEFKESFDNTRSPDSNTIRQLMRSLTELHSRPEIPRELMKKSLTWVMHLILQQAMSLH